MLKFVDEVINPLLDKVLRLGQVLGIVGDFGSKSAKDVATAAQSQAQSVSEMVTQTVKQGDTLSHIAAQNKMTLSELEKLNPDIFAQKFIHAGDEVILKLGEITKAAKGVTTSSIGTGFGAGDIFGGAGATKPTASPLDIFKKDMEVKAAEIIAIAERVPGQVVGMFATITGDVAAVFTAGKLSDFPFLESIVLESAKIPAKIVGFMLTLPGRIKSVLSSGDDQGDSGSGIQIFQNLIDIAAGVPTAVLSYMQLVVKNVKDTLSEAVPNLPFFDSILGFAINVFARTITLISTMKTMVKGLLDGNFDSSAFFTGIADSSAFFCVWYCR